MLAKQKYLEMKTKYKMLVSSGAFSDSHNLIIITGVGELRVDKKKSTITEKKLFNYMLSLIDFILKNTKHKCMFYFYDINMNENFILEFNHKYSDKIIHTTDENKFHTVQYINKYLDIMMIEMLSSLYGTQNKLLIDLSGFFKNESYNLFKHHQVVYVYVPFYCLYSDVVSQMKVLDIDEFGKINSIYSRVHDEKWHNGILEFITRLFSSNANGVYDTMFPDKFYSFASHEIRKINCILWTDENFISLRDYLLDIVKRVCTEMLTIDTLNPMVRDSNCVFMDEPTVHDYPYCSFHYRLIVNRNFSSIKNKLKSLYP